MIRSNAVLSLDKYRDFKPAITKVGTINDMSKIITQPLQKPIRIPAYNFSGLKYYK